MARQLRQRVVAYQHLGERLPCAFVQPLREQASQTPALGGQRLADQRLQCRVAGADNLAFVKPGDEFGDDEPRCDIAPHNLGGLLCELREEVRGPEAVAEQRRDHCALGIVFVFGNGLTMKRLIFEIAGQDECIILLCIVPAEAEESVLGLEVTDLQRTPDLGVEAGAAGSESQFRSGQRQIGQPLAIIEVGQPVQGELLGV